MWPRCIQSVPDSSDGPAVLGAAGLLGAEGWTQRGSAAAQGDSAAAAHILGKDFVVGSRLTCETAS